MPDLPSFIYDQPEHFFYLFALWSYIFFLKLRLNILQSMGVYDEGNQAQKQRKSIFIKHILFTAQYGLRALGYLRIIIISIHRAMIITWNYHGVRIHYIQLRMETVQGIGYSHFVYCREKT